MRTLLALLLAITAIACIAAKAASPTTAATATNPLPGAPQYCYTYVQQAGPPIVYAGTQLCPPAPPVTGCPAGRQTTSQVTYNYGADARRPGDITTMALFGKLGANDPIQNMPWAQGSHPTIYAFPQSGYIALPFVASVASGTGMFYQSETLPGPPVIGSISANCGDFSGRCVSSRPASPGQAIIGWKVGAGPTASCPLVQGGTYFLNLKIAAPTMPGGYSTVTLLSNHTP